MVKEIVKEIREATDLPDGMAGVLGLVRHYEVGIEKIPEAVREAINSEGVEQHDVLSSHLRMLEKKVPLGFFVVVGKWGTPRWGEVLAAFSEDGRKLDLGELEREGVILPRMAEPEDAPVIRDLFEKSEKARKAIISSSPIPLMRMGLQAEGDKLVEIDP